MSFLNSVKIGTRGSPMALAQAEEVRQQLEAHHPFLKGKIELITFTTSGDKFLSGPLRELGGKGLFTKELEHALLEKKIDCAVHSLKDMSAFSPEGLILPCVLKRTEVRDAFVSHRSSSLRTLEKGAIIGTASLRRTAFVKKVRPDCICVPIRGNVGSRIKKLRKPFEELTADTVDALILSYAGLCRIGSSDLATEIFDPLDLIPAPGQGAIVIQTRADHQSMLDILEPLNHKETYHCIQAERAFLRVAEGSCRLPIGAYARKENNHLILTGFLGTEKSEETVQSTLEGDFSFPENVGETLGLLLKKQLNH